MNTQTRLLPYSEDFIKSTNSGWGCGYVLIPLTHPFLVKQLLNNDTYFYPQIDGFSEEITYCENEGDYLCIGFDMAHSWNNIENSTKAVVEAKTNELKTLIDNYTMLDAKKEVENYFKELQTKFKDYL